MHFTKKKITEKRSDLVKKLQSKKLLRFPGAYNPLCAKLIAEIGFDGVYISGGVMSNDLGLPDIGLTTLDQVSYRSGQIARVTDLPTIVDVDTGFGSCKKTIEQFENKGLAGCHLEDQIAEKRCGHLDNKELVTKEEMVKKIQESVKARKDNNFLIIARTDANSVEGLDKTLDRIKAYEDAGADMIFPEAMKDEKEFEKVRKVSKGFLLANMTEFGRTPYITGQQFQDMGYKIVIWPVSQLRVALKAMEELYETIKTEDGTKSQEPKMKTREELYDLINYFDYEALDKSIVKSVVPKAAE